MSKDFPNRADWLARRATPAKLPGRYVHISKPLMTIKTERGTFETIVTPAKGSTLRIGSTQRKAKAFAAKRALKAMRRTAKRAPMDARYEASLTACAQFDAEKIAQEEAGRPMSKPEKIRDKSQLVPGAMYCCFLCARDFPLAPGEVDNGQHDVDGQLVYFGADGLFYDAGDGEECSPDYDYLVRQVGPINAGYAA